MSSQAPRIDDAESIHEDFRKILMPGGAGEAELHAAEAALFGGGEAVMAEPFDVQGRGVVKLT